MYSRGFRWWVNAHEADRGRPRNLPRQLGRCFEGSLAELSMVPPTFVVVGKGVPGLLLVIPREPPASRKAIDRMAGAGIKRRFVFHSHAHVCSAWDVHPTQRNLPLQWQRAMFETKRRKDRARSPSSALLPTLFLGRVPLLK